MLYFALSRIPGSSLRLWPQGWEIGRMWETKSKNKKFQTLSLLRFTHTCIGANRRLCNVPSTLCGFPLRWKDVERRIGPHTFYVLQLQRSPYVWILSRIVGISLITWLARKHSHCQLKLYFGVYKSHFVSTRQQYSLCDGQGICTKGRKYPVPMCVSSRRGDGCRSCIVKPTIYFVRVLFFHAFARFPRSVVTE